MIQIIGHRILFGDRTLIVLGNSGSATKAGSLDDSRMKAGFSDCLPAPQIIRLFVTE